MKICVINWCLPFLLLTLFFCPVSSKAYSVLTHEAVVDASWKSAILPLLREKYPAATDSQLMVAHSYAYGGCMMPDMGYFPFGSTYFTDLAHYVRTGDFVMNLLSEAQNLDEYAFALGSLCHYMADKYGHSIATNRVVPFVYKKDANKYGKVVTYEQDHIAHSRVEISFDVLQIARGNYASPDYHSFIGFNVAKPVLERAFLKTYGQDITTVFSNLDLAISTFRWSVKNLLPTLTRAAWVLRKNDIKKANPSANAGSFHYKMRRKDYYLEFGKERQQPGFGDRALAYFIKIMPKVGPLKALKFKDPGPDGEKLFIASFDTVLVRYATALHTLHSRNITLPDIDFDTGNITAPGEYGLADKTYDELVYKLKGNKFVDMTSTLKQNILTFYTNADTAVFIKQDPDWKKASLALLQMKHANPVKVDSLKTAKGVYYKLQQ
jgi:hypothetical protein